MTAADDPDSEPHPDPDDLFDEYVWTDPEVCSRCFAHIRELAELGSPSRSDVTVDLTSTTSTPATEWGHDVEATDEYGHNVVAYSSMVCGQCGSVGGERGSAGASIRTMLERAERIADRLRDHGLDPNVHRMKDAIRDAKRCPDRQGYETEIYREATAVGVSGDDRGS